MVVECASGERPLGPIGASSEGEERRVRRVGVGGCIVDRAE